MYFAFVPRSLTARRIGCEIKRASNQIQSSGSITAALLDCTICFYWAMMTSVVVVHRRRRHRRRRCCCLFSFEVILEKNANLHPSSHPPFRLSDDLCPLSLCHVHDLKGQGNRPSGPSHSPERVRTWYVQRTSHSFISSIGCRKAQSLTASR